MEIVYKIVPEKDWQDACQKGIYLGSEHDRRDGFIHLSSVEQVEETARRFFKNQKGLLLVAFDAEALGTKLCYEPSSHGPHFPHYYADLPTNLALWAKPMVLGEDLIPRAYMETK